MLKLFSRLVLIVVTSLAVMFVADRVRADLQITPSLVQGSQGSPVQSTKTTSGSHGSHTPGYQYVAQGTIQHGLVGNEWTVKFPYTGNAVTATLTPHRENVQYREVFFTWMQKAEFRLDFPSAEGQQYTVGVASSIDDTTWEYRLTPDIQVIDDPSSSSTSEGRFILKATPPRLKTSTSMPAPESSDYVAVANGQGIWTDTRSGADNYTNKATAASSTILTALSVNVPGQSGASTSITFDCHQESELRLFVNGQNPPPDAALKKTVSKTESWKFTRRLQVTKLEPMADEEPPEVEE